MINEKGDLSAGGMIFIGILLLAFSIHGVMTTPSIEPEVLEPRVRFMLTLMDAEIPGPQSVMVDDLYQLQIDNQVDWEESTAHLTVRTASVIICEALPEAMLRARQDETDIQPNTIAGVLINGVDVLLEEMPDPEKIETACDSDLQESGRHELRFNYLLPDASS